MEAEEQRRQMSQHEENEASLSLPCGRQKISFKKEKLLSKGNFDRKEIR